MLRVTIELLPHGDEATKTTVATLKIINRGTSMDKLRGDYLCIFEDKKGNEIMTRTNEVLNWRRLSKPVWSLVKAALVGARY